MSSKSGSPHISPVDPKEKDRRDKALDMAFTHINRQFGKGSIMRLGDGPEMGPIPTFSTGSVSLDAALGTGGLPRGRIVEIFGPESSGKTTVALHAAAQAQKRGGVSAFIDAEHALDPIYAKALGVQTDNLLVSQPDTGEQALEIAEILTSSGGVDLIVIDSVAALVPRAELEGEMGDHHVGLQARLMSQALRKLTGVVHKSMACFIFINQIRIKIGVMFGNPETTSGGNALKFYASVRLDIRRVASIKEGDVNVGNRTRVRVVKNKLSPPFRTAEFDIMFGAGISLEGDVLDLAVDQGVVAKTGAWYSFGDERIGQGRENVKRFLCETPDLFAEIEGRVRAELGISAGPPPAGEEKSQLAAKTATPG